MCFHWIWIWGITVKIKCEMFVWKDLLVLGLIVCVEEATAVKELRHDVGLEGHVERGACLLTLKQVGVVAHLHTNIHIMLV